MISGGRLRFQAEIFRHNESQDDLGKLTDKDWEPVGTFRCDVIDTGAVEVEYADGAAPQQSYELYARWDTINELSLTTKDKLEVTDGQTTLYLNITGIRNTNFKNRVAVIFCEGVIA